MIGRIESEDPNARPRATRSRSPLLAQPKKDGENCCRAVLVDPQRIQVARTAHGDLTVAMDLRPHWRRPKSRSRIGAPALQPLSPRGRLPHRFPATLRPRQDPRGPWSHGLMSTPRMWTPLVMELLADENDSPACPTLFLLCPTGQIVPLSAPERDAPWTAVAAHTPDQAHDLVGHSMGGILSGPGVRARPGRSRPCCRGSDLCLRQFGATRPIFEPRADVGSSSCSPPSRQPSRLQRSGGLGHSLTDCLPDTLISELGAALDHLAGLPDMRLPTSIQGLAEPQFLRVLDATTPVVPAHTILGDRGRGGDLLSSSDGVVPYTSAHLDTAESELVVPAGHSVLLIPESVKGATSHHP